jgi:hypothetical protein
MAAGQNYAPPTHAAIILSLEGVFAAIASYLFIGEHLSAREITGCTLMLVATVAAEIGCPAIDQLLPRKKDLPSHSKPKMPPRDSSSKESVSTNYVLSCRDLWAALHSVMTSVIYSRRWLQLKLSPQTSVSNNTVFRKDKDSRDSLASNSLENGYVEPHLSQNGLHSGSSSASASSGSSNYVHRHIHSVPNP